MSTQNQIHCLATFEILFLGHFCTFAIYYLVRIFFLNSGVFEYWRNNYAAKPMRELLEKMGQWIKGVLELFYFPFLRRFINSETYLYAATGGANLSFDILLYFIFLHYIFHGKVADFGFIAFTPHIAAFIFVFPITFASGFFLAKYVTFTASQLKGNKQLARYALSVGGSILLNYILLKLFVEYMHIYPTPSKMITAVFVVIYSFIVQKFFTFKTGKRQLEKLTQLAKD